MINKTRGVIYIVAGEYFTEMAIASAKSLKKHNPSLQVHLFSDQQRIESSFIDGQTLITNSHRRSKVDWIHQSPFEETLYLDADTFILENLDEMFRLLERFDIALSHSHKRNNPPNLQTWRTEIPYAFPQLNGGIILFRKNKKTIQLLEDWEKYYHESGFKKDQVTLRELLWLSDLRIHVLPPEYNVRFKKYLDIWTKEEAKAKILHFEEFTLFFKAVWEKKMSNVCPENENVDKLHLE